MTSSDGTPAGASGFPSSAGTEGAAAGGNGLAADVHALERAIFEVKRVIVGQDQLVERILVGLLAVACLVIWRLSRRNQISHHNVTDSADVAVLSSAAASDTPGEPQLNGSRRSDIAPPAKAERPKQKKRKKQRSAA